MGKASRVKYETGRQAKIATQRAAARRAEQRRRLFIAPGSVVVVVAVVVTFVLVKVNGKSGAAAASSEGPTGAALTSLVNQVTGVPQSTLDTIGGGSINSGGVGAGSASNGGASLAPVSGSPLTSGGKPEVLYVGAEYCPYCAAERWSMIVALSRFGTFSGLSTTHSSSIDTDPNTPTFTFYGSSYASRYVSFTAVEETKNYQAGGSYVPLQTPTSAEQALLTRYDTSKSIPFLDIGNSYLQVGDLPGVDPSILAGLSWSQIGADLSNPSSPVAQAVDGAADYLTAAICKLTGNQPATACTPAVKTLEAKL